MTAAASVTSRRPSSWGVLKASTRAPLEMGGRDESSRQSVPGTATKDPEDH